MQGDEPGVKVCLRHPGLVKCHMMLSHDMARVFVGSMPSGWNYWGSHVPVVLCQPTGSQCLSLGQRIRHLVLEGLKGAGSVQPDPQVAFPTSISSFPNSLVSDLVGRRLCGLTGQAGKGTEARD